jgi:hypothetical protein
VSETGETREPSPETACTKAGKWEPTLGLTRDTGAGQRSRSRVTAHSRLTGGGGKRSVLRLASPKSESRNFLHTYIRFVTALQVQPPRCLQVTRKTYYLHTAKNTHVAASTRSGALRSLCQSSQLYRLDHGGRCPHTSEAVRHDVSSRPKSPERRSRTPKPNAEAEGRRRAVL